MPIHRSALRLCVVAALAVAARAQFTVTGASPANNARNVSPAAVVTLQFSAPVAAATVTPQNIRLAGRWSGPVPVQLSIGAGGTTVTLSPLRPLFATEIATLYVSHFVTSATGTPLNGGFTSTWWIASVPSTGQYVLDQVVDYRRPGEGPIRTYGFFAGDVDRDGSPDMSATNEVAFDIRLLKNDGCGHFGAPTITALPSGHEPSPNEGADFNGDGWIDLATGNQNGQSVAVFLNNGAGSYLAPLVIPAGGQVHGLALLDCDSDGDIDIVATNQANIVLIRNNGNGTFQAPTFFDGGNGEWSIATADANGDGKPDLFCGQFANQQVAVLLGDGNGNFTPTSSRFCGGFPWQMATGDVNGDGIVDCVVANNNNATVGVLTGTGTGTLNAVVTFPAGTNPVSMDLGDAEGDGDLDIVCANFSSGNATLLRNNGAGSFGNASSLAASSAGSCAVVVDFDRDGDTDVILVDELDDKAFVWRQNGPIAAATQTPSCGAALRVNGFAGRGGFGSVPPTPLPAGRLAFFNVSGAAGQPYAVVLGSRLSPGLPLFNWGVANVDLTLPFDIPINGFFGSPLGTLDAFGEQTLAAFVPGGLAPGSTLTVQAAVFTSAGMLLSNAETVVF
jgi:hypothetical protein